MRTNKPDGTREEQIKFSIAKTLKDRYKIIYNVLLSY